MNVASLLRVRKVRTQNATHHTLYKCLFQLRTKSCLPTLQHRLLTILKPKYRMLTLLCPRGYLSTRSTSQSQFFTHKKIKCPTTKLHTSTPTKTTAAKHQVMTHKCRFATRKQSKIPHQANLTTIKGQPINRPRLIQQILRLAINPKIRSMSS